MHLCPIYALRIYPVLVTLRDDNDNNARLALRAKTKKRAVVDQLCPIYALWTSPTPTPTPGPIERHIKCFLLAICTSPTLHIIVIVIAIQLCFLCHFQQNGRRVKHILQISLKLCIFGLFHTKTDHPFVIFKFGR